MSTEQIPAPPLERYPVASDLASLTPYRHLVAGVIEILVYDLNGTRFAELWPDRHYAVVARLAREVSDGLSALGLRPEMSSLGGIEFVHNNDLLRALDRIMSRWSDPRIEVRA